MKNQKNEQNSAQAEIEMWRSKSAILSTLHQQLSHPLITTVKKRVTAWQNESSPSTVVMDFEGQMKELTKIYNEAKDNVKFLTTLERQFKNLASEGLSGVEETLPSLMNGLKTVWTISRHYKSDEKMMNLLNLISNEIADKVESQINIQELFKLNDKIPYQGQLQQTIDLINHGKNILNSWVKLYKQTKQKIEDDGNNERWDFTVQGLFRIEHMILVLGHLFIIADILLKFLVFLPNLKQVTGNSEGIDFLVGEVKKLIIPFETSEYNFFHKNHNGQWQKLFNEFKAERQTIEE